MELPYDERVFFHTFGYLVLRGLFAPAEIAAIDAEHATGFVANEPLYAAPIGVRGQMSWSHMRADTPVLAAMLEHERLLAVAEQLLDEPIGVMCNGNVFTGSVTEWHADTSVPDFRGLKLVAYLQTVDGDSGALRVLPGSHRSPWHEQLAVYSSKSSTADAGNPEAARVDVSSLPGQVCATEPGDVIAFDLRTWHASANGFPGRRMCSFTYFAEPTNDAERAATAAVAEQLRKEALYRELRRQREWRRNRPDVPTAEIPVVAPQYDDLWREVGVSPRRHRWLTTLEALGLLERRSGSAA